MDGGPMQQEKERERFCCCCFTTLNAVHALCACTHTLAAQPAARATLGVPLEPRAEQGGPLRAGKQGETGRAPPPALAAARAAAAFSFPSHFPTRARAFSQWISPPACSGCGGRACRC